MENVLIIPCLTSGSKLMNVAVQGVSRSVVSSAILCGKLGRLCLLLLLLLPGIRLSLPFPLFYSGLWFAVVGKKTTKNVESNRFADFHHPHFS